MDLHVATAFIRSCKSSPTCVTGKWLFSSVSTDVSCQMVWTGKVPHANSTLEWFLSSVGSHVACQFIRPWEPPWAGLHWASIRSLIWWCSWASISRVVPFGFQYRVTSFWATSMSRLAWHCKKVSWWCCVQEEFVHHCSMIRRHSGRKWRRATKDWPLHVQCSCSLHKHWWCVVRRLLHGSLVKVGLGWELRKPRDVLSVWSRHWHLLLRKVLWSGILYLVLPWTWFLWHRKFCVLEEWTPRCSSGLAD